MVYSFSVPRRYLISPKRLRDEEGQRVLGEVLRIVDPKLQSCVHLSHLNSVLAALAELFPSSAFPEVSLEVPEGPPRSTSV